MFTAEVQNRFTDTFSPLKVVTALSAMINICFFFQPHFRSSKTGLKLKWLLKRLFSCAKVSRQHSCYYQRWFYRFHLWNRSNREFLYQSETKKRDFSFGGIISLLWRSLHLIIYFIYYHLSGSLISELHWRKETLWLALKTISWVCNKTVNMLKGPGWWVQLTGAIPLLFCLKPSHSFVWPQKTYFLFSFFLC